jgi:predicted small metal-binding protein
VEIPEEETMIIQYACKDMGLNCNFRVKGEAVEVVVQTALEHVREKHAQEFNLIQSPEQIEVMRKSLERSTKVVV